MAAMPLMKIRLAIDGDDRAMGGDTNKVNSVTDAMKEMNLRLQKFKSDPPGTPIMAIQNESRRAMDPIAASSLDNRNESMNVSPSIQNVGTNYDDGHGVKKPRTASPSTLRVIKNAEIAHQEASTAIDEYNKRDISQITKEGENEDQMMLQAAWSEKEPEAPYGPQAPKNEDEWSFDDDNL